jgi:hypothetical protein
MRSVCREPHKHLVIILWYSKIAQSHLPI